jgi:hypothetical protein
MTKQDTTESTRKPALKMLAAGIASPSEVVELAGVSRALVGYWIKAAGLDWRKARAEALAKAWRKIHRA